jgi:uncharacterized protein
MNVEADTGQSTIEELDAKECRKLLRSESYGRVAVVVEGQPLIFPVNYRFEDDAVVFRTNRGTKLTGAEFSRVAFEVDRPAANGLSGWSVVIQGWAYEATDLLDTRSEHLLRVPVPSALRSENDPLVEILAERITGRRVGTAPDADAALPAPSVAREGSGDLSRRLMLRREALGLSREAVARQARIDPGYLLYLERHAGASPGEETLAKLAGALRTSPDALRGAEAPEQGEDW